MKARRRLGAFIIDLFIVVMLATTLANLSYLNPYKDQYNECQNELNNVMIDYQGVISDVSSKDSFKTALNYVNDKMVPLLMVLEKYNVFNLIWYVLIFFLYNVLFAYFNNGQTLGKKIFKLKVVNKGENNVSFSRMLIRGLFNGSSLYFGVVIVAIIRIFTSLIMNKYVFLVLFYGVEVLSYILEVSLLITLFTSKGTRLTNDIIAKTEVIEVK